MRDGVAPIFVSGNSTYGLGLRLERREIFQRPAEPELGDDLSAQDFQRPFLPRPKGTRHAINYAQGSEGWPFRSYQRRSGVESNVRAPGHQRIISETFVAPGISFPLYCHW